MSLYDEVMGLTLKQVAIIATGLAPVGVGMNYFAHEYVKKAIAEEGFASKKELEAQKKLLEEVQKAQTEQNQSQGILRNEVGQIQAMQKTILDAILKGQREGN